MFLRTLFLALCLSSMGFAESEPKVAVLSYFRSGTHWFNYILTQLTGRPWEKTVLAGWFVHTDHPHPEKVPFIHQHSYVNLKHLDPQKDKLILLLRNNKENLIGRFGPEKFDGLFDRIKESKGWRNAALYYRNLLFFHNWPEENRFLVYYKDLIESPEEVFKELLPFLDENFDYFDDFFAHLEDHRKFSHGRRRGRTGGKFLHYSLMVPREKLVAYDEKVRQTYPQLYPYLKPFDTTCP